MGLEEVCPECELQKKKYWPWLCSVTLECRERKQVKEKDV